MKTNTIELNENFEVAENLIITEFKKLENFIDENFKVLMVGAYRHPEAYVCELDYSATRIFFNKYNLIVSNISGIKRIGEFDCRNNNLEELKESDLILLTEAIQELMKSKNQEVSCSFEIKIVSK